MIKKTAVQTGDNRLIGLALAIAYLERSIGTDSRKTADERAPAAAYLDNINAVNALRHGSSIGPDVGWFHVCTTESHRR